MAGIRLCCLLQRINFNANAGGGAVYPDPVRNGFLKYDADFQQALQQAWWHEIRALRLQEHLDPHIVIIADFAAHFNEANKRSSVVGGVPEKLRTDLEEAGIDEVLTSSGEPLFHSATNNVITEPDGSV